MSETGVSQAGSLSPKGSYWMKGIVAVVTIAAFIGVYLFFRTEAPTEKLPTYFSYTDSELAALNGLRSSQVMKADEIYRWDRRFFDLVSKNSALPFPAFDERGASLYAYLAVAERDAAHLSYNASGTFSGSLEPLMHAVLCRLLAEDCNRYPVPSEIDEYSQTLSDIVMKKVEARLAADESARAPYPVQTGTDLWDGPQLSIGLSEASKKPWLIEKADQFRVPPPPAANSPEMLDQLAATKKFLKEATAEEKSATVSWAGGPGTSTPPGLWLAHADEYMRNQNISFEQVVDVRALLTMAIADANIAVFDSKYTYFMKRPFMYDRSIVTIMPTPNHPGYPSGHSALSTAAAEVLSVSFPEAESSWRSQALEAGLSRVWGGIHFPIDHEQSVILGTGVGKEAVRAFAR